MPIRLLVNGRTHQVEAPADTPLLWVLRDDLGLTGTKFGCGMGMCGACTVHIAGRAQRSCLTTLGSIGSKPVTTIEGLSQNGTHPVQAAWIAEDVPQCGYCQTGQIMTVAACLAANPHASEDQVIRELEGNLCRCGTYARIRKAIHHLVAGAR